MATITLTDVPDDLYARLAARAAENRRSLSAEVVASLQAAGPNPAGSDEVGDRVRRLRERLAADGTHLTLDDIESGEIRADLAALHDRQRREGVWLTDRAIEAAIEEGRE